MSWENCLILPGAARRARTLMDGRERAVAAASELAADARPRLLAEAFREGRKPYAMAGNVAVVPVKGFLDHDWPFLDSYWGITGYDAIRLRIDAAVEDPDVAGILLHVNSFGGMVSGCFDLAERVRAARDAKPVWACVDEASYSAAYALASQADRVLLPRTGGVGSIGVVTIHMDFSAMLEAEGLKVTLLHAGAHKVDGNPFEPLPEEVAAEIQEDLETVRGFFAEAVAAGRGISAEDALATEARTYDGAKAIEAGLADDIMPAAEVLPAFIAALSGAGADEQTASGASAMKTKQTAGRRSKPAARGRAARHKAENAPPEDEDAEASAAEDGDDEDQAEDDPADEEMEDDGEDADAEEDEETPQASARTKERKRVAAILGSKHAKGNEDLAKHLAFNTSQSAADAVAVLMSAGGSKAKGGQLGAIMPQNADIDADGGGDGKKADAGASWAASADRVFGAAKTNR